MLMSNLFQMCFLPQIALLRRIYYSCSGSSVCWETWRNCLGKEFLEAVGDIDFVSKSSDFIKKVPIFILLVHFALKWTHFRNYKKRILQNCL